MEIIRYNIGKCTHFTNCKVLHNIPSIFILAICKSKFIHLYVAVISYSLETFALIGLNSWEAKIGNQQKATDQYQINRLLNNYHFIIALIL